MSQLKRGLYQTQGGHDAVITRLRQIGMQWVWDGAVFIPAHGVWSLTSWNFYGVHDASIFDLKVAS